MMESRKLKAIYLLFSIFHYYFLFSIIYRQLLEFLALCARKGTRRVLVYPSKFCASKI